MADEREVLAARAGGRVPRWVEPVLVEGVQDDRDLLGRGTAFDEPLAHLIRARDHRAGEADARLLEEAHEPDGPGAFRSLVSGGEVLRHALVQIEEHSSTEQAGNDGRERQPVGERVHLDERVAATQVEESRERGRGELDQHVLGEVARKAASAPRDRDAKDPQAAALLEPGLTRPRRADEVHLVTGTHERLDLAAHPGVVGEVPLPDHADVRHHAAFGASSRALASTRNEKRPSATPSTIMLRL